MQALELYFACKGSRKAA